MEEMGCLAGRGSTFRSGATVSRTKIRIDLTQVDKEAGKHWLSKLTKEELKLRLEEIRHRHREKYLQQQSRS
jgi:hypothetical protein